jgi:putative zinc finger protein
MSATHREWTDRLSDYVAGELDAHELEAVENHLAECGSCRRVLEEVRDVIARAGALEELRPPRDLWAGIAATIQAPVRAPAISGARVIALPSAGTNGPHGSDGPDRSDARGGDRTRITLSLPQLAATSIALVTLSAATMWMAGLGLGVDGEEAPATMPTGAVAMVSDVPELPEGLSAQLSALEEPLAAAFATLDPNTVRILERNLNVVEQAIADSRQALAQDPGNEFLIDHLDRVYQRKLTYMRAASRLVEWTG